MTTQYRLTVSDRDRVEQRFDSLIDHCVDPIRLRVVANSDRWWTESLTPDNKLFLSVATKTNSKSILKRGYRHTMDVAAPDGMRYRYNYRIGKQVGGNSVTRRNPRLTNRKETLTLPEVSGRIGVPLIDVGHPIYKEMLDVCIETMRMAAVVNMLQEVTNLIHTHARTVGQLKALVPDISTILPDHILETAGQYTRKPSLPKYFKDKIAADKKYEREMLAHGYKLEQIWSNEETISDTLSTVERPSTVAVALPPTPLSKRVSMEYKLQLLSDWLGKGLINKVVHEKRVANGDEDVRNISQFSLRNTPMEGTCRLDVTRDTDRLPMDEQ